MDKNPNVRRVIVDYDKLTPEVLGLAVEKYPGGYGDDDVVTFKNAKGELIQAIEICTEGTKYLIRISKKLERTMTYYDTAYHEGFDEEGQGAVQDPDILYEE